MFTVIDCEFNQSHYPDLIYQSFDKPPSYVIVKEISITESILLEALRLMIVDLNHCGELFETDEKRIEHMQEAIKEAIPTLNQSKGD